MPRGSLRSRRHSPDTPPGPAPHASRPPGPDAGGTPAGHSVRRPAVRDARRAPAVGPWQREPLAASPRAAGIELLLEPFTVPLPAIPVAVDLRQVPAQPRDLPVLLLDARVPRIILTLGRVLTLGHTPLVGTGAPNLQSLNADLRRDPLNKDRWTYRSRKGRQSVLSYASGFAFNSASCSLINALISWSWQATLSTAPYRA